MGAKSSKIFKTPDSVRKKFNAEFNKLETKDPRSPDVLRTPLNELDKADQESFFVDPRSPTSCILRTPIVFESDQSKSFIFEEEDTFTELFSADPYPRQKIEENKTEEVDPRSPSLQIDRTPLIFEDNVNFELPKIVLSDEEDENEDDIIKSVLDMIKTDENEKPRHKQLERVKNMHKKSKSNRKTKDNGPRIYQDSNVFYSTPKKSFLENDFSENKRTPLGCVGNKPRFRSRSVENIKNKSLKTSSNLNFNEGFFKPIKHISPFEIESENNSFII